MLVLKYIPMLFPPQRWDVPVFKNPPDPVGDTQNYIKRLVGLPNESLVLADGDVFTGTFDGQPDAMRIQRKPEVVQRAVWQPVWRSDWMPVDGKRMEQTLRRSWPGPAFKPIESERGEWKWGDRRDWMWPNAAPTQLQLDAKAWPLTDWNSYNAWRRVPEFPTSDLRVSGAFQPSDPAKFEAWVQLVSRGVKVTAGVKSGEAFASVTSMATGNSITHATAALSTPVSLVAIDVWHVDQAVWLFVNGKRLIEMPYELKASGTSPLDRLSAAGIDLERYVQDPVGNKPKSIESLEWKFGGSAFVARNLRIDRDLYYQPGSLLAGNQVMTNGPLIVGRAFACDPNHPARLGPNDYLMFGDNSPASRDGRYWGRPHPILKSAINFDAPFVVPGELLVGKAWCVYFPATFPLGAGLTLSDPAARSTRIVPNFGSLRFIR